MKDLSQATLKKFLSYNIATGDFHRKVSSGRGKVGSCPQTTDGYGYWKICVDGCEYKAHRLVWLYIHGEFPKKHIDHINHNRKDNRLSNLREVTPQQNQRNMSKSRANTSNHTGVYWDKTYSLWKAQTHVNGTVKHLGRFKKLEDAVAARAKSDKREGYHENHGRTQDEE